jgi:hypothetical protein
MLAINIFRHSVASLRQIKFAWNLFIMVKRKRSQYYPLLAFFHKIKIFGIQSSESQEGVLLKNLLLAAHDITECLLDISFIKRHIPELDPKLRSTLFGHSVAHETAVEELAVLFRCWLEPSIRACGVLKLPSCGVKEIAENFQELLIEPGTAFFRKAVKSYQNLNIRATVRIRPKEFPYNDSKQWKVIM